MAFSFLGATINPLNQRNPAVVNLIIWCVAAWVLTALLNFVAPALVTSLMFTPNLDLFLHQPWSLFSYIFLHQGFVHLFVNMLWLFFIGSILEDMTGKTHVWKLFIGGGVAGALLFMLVYQLFYHSAAPALMVGASGGVTAIIVGTATLSPNYQILLFGILPVELVWIAAIRVFLDLLGASGPVNQGGYICHLGGAAFGLLYMLHTKGKIHIPGVDWLGNTVKKWFSRKPAKPRRTARVNIRKSEAKSSATTVNQAEIDRILDKINATGYDSLTKAEKEELFKAGS